MYFVIKNQIFNIHSMPLSFRKMSRRIVQKLSQTNAKTSCLNPKSGHYTTARRGNFLSHEKVDDIDGIKTPLKHAKTGISASKSIFHSFHAVLWSMYHTQKIFIPIHLRNILK